VPNKHSQSGRSIGLIPVPIGTEAPEGRIAPALTVYKCVVLEQGI